jgi:hypothetical protein
VKGQNSIITSHLWLSETDPVGSVSDKDNHKKSKEISGESKKIQDFLIQLMDDTGQIGEKCLRIRYEIERDKN